MDKTKVENISITQVDISELKPAEYDPRQITCKICGKNFLVIPALINIRKFCSRPCYHKHLTTLKKPLSEATKIKIGKANSRKITLACDFCGDKVVRSPSHIQRHKTIFCSSICYGKFISIYHTRDNAFNWQGGKNSLHEEIRKSKQANLWRTRIFKRDKYQCQNCDEVGGDIEAHHIKTFSILLKEFLHQYNQFSPTEDIDTLIQLAVSYEPFWDIANGKTLCKKCHNKTKIRCP